MKPSLPLLALAAAALPVGAQEMPPPPDLGRAFVTIPYSELRALWEAGQRKKESPKEEPERAPVAFLVHRAEYRLQIGDESSRLEADYEIESLDKKWQTIPLLGGDAQLEKADAGECSILSQDGYALLTNQPGKAQATLHLVTSGAKKMLASQALKLRLGSATVKRFSIRGVPPKMEVRLNGLRASEVKDGTALFFLAGAAGEASIELTAARVEEPLKAPQPSHWQVQSQVLVRHEEGRLHFKSHLSAHADDGSGMEIFLLLPPNAGAVTVEGEDVAAWAALKADEGRQRVLGMHWKNPDLLDRELTLAYAVPLSPPAEQWSLQAPATPGHAEAQNLFAIIAAEGLELKGEGVRVAVASQRLPQWMREEIGGQAFVTAEGGAQVVLTSHWLPTVATAEAIVSEAKCELRLVADGSLQTSATYAIRHASPLAWRVELPAEVELLTCLVDGKSAHPVQRENGSLELTLPASGDSRGVTTAAFVYATKTKPLDPVSGQLALEMPRTPLFIEHLEWSVGIPGNYEITAIDGNVAASGGAKTDRDVLTIALRKRLLPR